jgi:cullin 1
LYNAFLQIVGTYLEGVVRELEAVPMDCIMAVYCRKWKQFVTSCKIIDHLYRYLNNHWIKRQHDDGFFHIFYIKDVRQHF